MAHALVVDDDADAAASLRELIAGERFTVAVARTLRDARRQIALQQPDIVLLDPRLPDGNAVDLLSDAQLAAHTEVVLCTSPACCDSAAQAQRLGAAVCLTKPVQLQQLQAVLSRVRQQAPLHGQGPAAQALLHAHGPAAQAPGPAAAQFGPLSGNSAAMQHIYQQISRVAATSVTVFISGESGTGKELVAQAVHDFSARRKRPFLAVNCGAISRELIESELFGHEKGSFTGASRQHQGYFERASGGTLFLDEITEMPPELQVKLLRVLETGRFMRVGSSQSQTTDVRIISATNRPPQLAVATGRLREDLLYRLNVFPLHLPPLRERLSDVPLLARLFLHAMGEQEGHFKHFSAAALAQLASCSWPGNVRELRNVVQRAYVMAPGGTIDVGGLQQPGLDYFGQPNAVAVNAVAMHAVQASPPRSRHALHLISAANDAANDVASGPGADCVTLRIGTSLAQAERLLMLATLQHCNHHKERTAAVLGISLKTLYNRLKESGAAAQLAPALLS